MAADRLGGDKGAFAEQLVDASQDALIALSLDGLILSWGGGAQAMFGHSAETAVGQPIDSLIVPKEYQSEARRARAQVIDARATTSESVSRRKDGALIHLSVSMQRINVPGAEPFIAVSARDTTELKRLRDGQQRTRDANGLNSAFLTSMSHELRTPLNAIIGFAELMHKGKVGPVSASHQEYLGDILTSSNHLLQLINDVLDLAKVESGTMDLRPECVDPTKLVGDVRDILRGLAATKKLHVETGVDPEFSSGAASVVVDPARVKQVVYNYLSNAIRFTQEGGCITIRVLSEGPDLFRLAVEDTGIGVSPENLDQLFVESQPADARGVENGQGSCFGLVLTKKIVEAHGGRVEVMSVPGKGSTFSAVFPRRTGAARPKPRAGEGRLATRIDTDALPGSVSGQ